jgi:K+-sensing histidine kinase KdpD
MSREHPQESLNVPWPDLVKFVRQLGHDIRNHLNAVELQSAYLAELAEGSEIKEEIRRLREMVSEIGASFQKLGAALSTTNPTLISYTAADFVDDLKQKLAKDFPNEDAKVSWEIQLKDEKLQIDPQLAQQALLELFANAFRHERNVKGITTKVYVDGSDFVFELHEPKAKFDLSTKNWGREPLRQIGQSHYGLGLNRTRTIIEAHGGKFAANYERSTSTLTTRIILPIAR